MKNKYYSFKNSEIDKLKDKICKTLYPHKILDDGDKWNIFIDTCGLGEYNYINNNIEFFVRNRRKFGNAKLTYGF